jgi:hypothetical protein
MVEAYCDVIRWSIREAQASRLAPMVPSSGPAEHGTRGPGVIVRIVLASLPSMRWHHCLCCAGVIALVALASAHWQCCSDTLSLQSWRLCRCCAGVLACIALGLALLLAGIVTHIALASLPLRWRHHQNCIGVFTHALASSFLSHWCLPNCYAATRWSHRAAVLAVLRWRSCVHRAGVIVCIGWCHHQHCTGVFALFC